MDSACKRHCSELVARERSGHTAVVEENLLYVWGGYMVRKTNKQTQTADGLFNVFSSLKDNNNGRNK